MDELIIHVFDNTGKKLHVITGDYEKIKITGTQIKQYREGFKYKFRRGLDVILKRTVFPEYFPAIRHFNVSDGKVYVMTFKKRILYQLVENEDEEWELHVTKIQ